MYYAFLWIGNGGKDDLGKYLVFCLFYWCVCKMNCFQTAFAFSRFLALFLIFLNKQTMGGCFPKAPVYRSLLFYALRKYKTQLFYNILQYFTSSHACLFISKVQHCIGSTSPFFLQRVGKSWQRNTFPAMTRWQIPH